MASTRRLALAGLVIGVSFCWTAGAQVRPEDHGAIPPAGHGGWPDKDAAGRPAPMTFGAFHVPQLLYGDVVETLTASGCKREEAETFIRFDCAAEPKQWYLTKPGRPEHPALSFATGGGRMLSETLTLNPEPPSIERRKAYDVWQDELPNCYRPPAGGLLLDWVAILKDAPLNDEQIKGVTYERLIAAVSAASDCKRDEPHDYTVFHCANSKTRWYFTREGMPAHMAWAMMYSGLHAGGEEESYLLGRHARSRPASDDGRPPTPEQIAARERLTDAWIRTLPGQKGWNAQPPPLSFSLKGAPITEEELQKGPLWYDGAVEKVKAAGCTSKTVGEYVAYSCKDTKLFFIFTTPEAEAYPSMSIAEPDVTGRNVNRLSTRMFYWTGPTIPPVEQLKTAFKSPSVYSKWSRGIDYLQVSQIR